MSEPLTSQSSGMAAARNAFTLLDRRATIAYDSMFWGSNLEGGRPFFILISSQGLHASELKRWEGNVKRSERMYVTTANCGLRAPATAATGQCCQRILQSPKSQFSSTPSKNVSGENSPAGRSDRSICHSSTATMVRIFSYRPMNQRFRLETPDQKTCRCLQG